LLQSITIANQLKDSIKSAEDFLKKQWPSYNIELKDPLNKDGSKNQDNFKRLLEITQLCQRTQEKCKQNNKLLPKAIDSVVKLEKQAV